MTRRATLDPGSRMLEEALGAAPGRNGAPALAPGVDVIERSDEILVRAALPGLRKDAIEISVSGTVLTLRGLAPEDKKAKDEPGEYYRREIPHGAFTRTLVLPAEVDEAKAKAALKDGLLEIRLPKPTRPRRHLVHID